MNSSQPAKSNRAEQYPEKHQSTETVIDSQVLLQGKKVVFIQHGDQRYQLRSTKENKLILTK